MLRPSRAPCPACAMPRHDRAAARRTSCPTSSAAPLRTRRSASSAPSCAASLASTGNRTSSERRPRYDPRMTMYTDALSFLEDERDAWRPYETLSQLTDEELERPVEAAHDWSGRDLMAHLVHWQLLA